MSQSTEGIRFGFFLVALGVVATASSVFTVALVIVIATNCNAN